MIPIPTEFECGWRTGHTDIRKGFASLSLQVQEVLRRDHYGRLLLGARPESVL